MKIFLSWSGPRSRAVAEALHTWLPRVIQAVEVFFSPDIEKGAKWGNEIDDALEGTSFGIVVITKDNLASPWLHYEAGALSKLDGARVWTFLLDVTNAEVPPPLGRFQHTEAKRDEVFRMLQSINTRLSDVGETPLKDSVLQDVFEDAWPRLASKLDDARASARPDVAASASEVRSGGRSEREMLEEVLELLRAQQRPNASASEPAGPIGSAGTPSGSNRAKPVGIDEFTVKFSDPGNPEDFVRHLHRLLPVQKSRWDQYGTVGLGNLWIHLQTASSWDRIQDAVEMASARLGLPRLPIWSIIASPVRSTIAAQDATEAGDGFDPSTQRSSGPT